MDFNDHTIVDILKSLEGEVAKSLNEIRHAQDDLDKAQNRQKFILAVTHHLKQRYEDMNK
jgi:hypothetical protein